MHITTQILGQIYFNYRQLELAKIIWHKAITFSQSSHYTQIKAKSLIGLGCIERQVGNFGLAEQYHQEAVSLLEQINAKCDLAEAYLQWGITRHIKNHQASRDLFESAIKFLNKSQLLNKLSELI